MTLKERKLYKSGKRNPNGYSFNPFDYFDNKRRVVIVCVLITISLFFNVLCLFGFTSWQKLLSDTNLVDSVKQQDSDFVVYFLDVGQGDCTIVICDGEVLLIDSGTVNQAYNIRTHLFMLEIDKIDYLLVTHQHDDHMGSAAEIINHYSVSNILMPELSYDNNVNSPTYDNLIKTISNNNINTKAVSYGDSFMLGSAYVEIIAPMKKDNNINNMSVVTKITYGNNSFLFTGDCEKDVEKQILREGVDVSADVISVAHHGSKTSSSNNFLSAVNPKYAIISCGIDNNYGHPSLETLEIFEDFGMFPYITSVHGDVTVTSDGNNVTVISEKTVF